MNMLRELQCADYLNQHTTRRALTDEELWRMVTANAADLTDTCEKLGRIAPGKVADLAIFRLRAFARPRTARSSPPKPEDVVLTVRGGKALYGDAAVVQAPDDGTRGCDAWTCAAAPSVCVTCEIGSDARRD